MDIQYIRREDNITNSFIGFLVLREVEDEDDKYTLWRADHNKVVNHSWHGGLGFGTQVNKVAI